MIPKLKVAGKAKVGASTRLPGALASLLPWPASQFSNAVNNGVSRVISLALVSTKPAGSDTMALRFGVYDDPSQSLLDRLDHLFRTFAALCRLVFNPA